MDARGSEWWQTRWFFAAATLFACVPLVWPAFPPLTDLLGHAGRFRVMLDDGHGPLAQWFTVHWRPVGNMGADGIVAVLGPLIGLEPAVRLVAMAAPALTVAGCLALSRAAHGRVSPFALFALPLAYNHPFHTGFLNFALGMGLALLALALWLRMADSRWRAVAFVPVALVLWTCHAFAWAVLGLIAFAAEVARRRNPLTAALACWPFLAPLPLMLLWRVTTGGATFGFLNIEAKLVILLMAFRDRWFVVDVATLAIVVTVIVYGVRKAGSAKPIAWSAVALLAAFVALPDWLAGSAFADMRAAPFVLILALIALRPVDERQARAVALIGLAFFVARISATTASLALAGARQDRELAALHHVPVGSRIALFVAPECREPWRMARLDHIGGLATARRRSFVNDQWPDIGASLMTTHYPQARPVENDRSQLLPCDDGRVLARRIASVPRDAFDRLWLVNIPQGTPAALPGMTRLWSDGDSALYRIDRR